MSLIHELQRRNVIRVAIGYLAGAWLLIQILETLFPIFGLPETAVRGVVIALAIGFIPALVLSWVFEWTPEGFRREADVSAQAPRSATRKFDRLVTAALVLALGYFAFDKFLLDPSRDAEQIAEAVEVARTEAVLGQYEGRSILVLPFVNMSSDPEQEFFSDGITEEMLNLLAKMPELRVISRSTAFTFKGKEVDIREAAERLDVSHVLEGSVRKSGNRIRITAQLIAAATDTHLWSDAYDRELKDVFAIQDEISMRVVDELKVRLLTKAPSADEIDPAAYEDYLRARQLSRIGTDRTFEQIVPLLDAVLAVAPDYVPAIYERARAVVWNSDDFEEEVALVRAYTARMTELQPLSSYTNSFRAWIALNYDADIEAAARYLELAVADDLFNPEPVTRRVVDMYSQLGRHDEAMALAEIMIDRDPACVLCLSGYLRAARTAGRYRMAAQRAESVLDWYPPNENLWWSIGAAWLAAGEPEKALEYFEMMAAQDMSMGSYGRVLALYDLGRTEEFEAAVERYRREQGVDEGLARIMAWTGDAKATVAMLEQVADEMGKSVMPVVLSSDLYARIYDAPEFVAFRERFDIPAEDVSRVYFDPPLPPAIRAEMERRIASVKSSG